MRIAPVAVLIALGCSMTASEPLPKASASPKKQSMTCPKDMVLIPAATFIMGSTPDDPADRQHRVTITKPYCIDRTPVTVAAYRKCVEASGCSEPELPLGANYGEEGRDNHPVNGVTWSHADTYCKWANKRLPTDAEWELAARGTDGRHYPWGNQEPDDTRMWWSRTTRRSGTAPVGSHPKGASPYGVQDMFGNVAQWVADYSSHFTSEPQVDPTGPERGESKVVRGVGYHAGLLAGDISGRHPRHPDLTSAGTGFHCAR